MLRGMGNQKDHYIAISKIKDNRRKQKEFKKKEEKKVLSNVIMNQTKSTETSSRGIIES